MIIFFAIGFAMLALALWFPLAPLLRRAPGAGSAPRQRWPVLLILVLLPALAAVQYLVLGNRAALRPPAQEALAQSGAGAAAGVGPEQVEAMVGRLAAKLKAQPNDAAGWRMLARSYETLRRFELAADAYRHLLALEPDDPDLLVDYAVVLGMTLDHSLSGAPQVQIERALAIDPNHIQALALSGSAALERGDYANAVKPWKKILALVPAESEIGRSIAASIAKAESQAQGR